MHTQTGFSVFLLVSGSQMELYIFDIFSLWNKQFMFVQLQAENTV